MTLREQNRTITGSVPLDRPTSDRPHRLYVATTNHCNRACPWCSTCSSPAGTTFLSIEAFRASFPPTGHFETQLEGGEPTVHPLFWQLVEAAREEPRCTRVVVVTNGTRLARERTRLRDWVARLGAPSTVKLSINHYLLEHDPRLLELATLLRDVFGELGDDRELVLNVRLRRNEEDDDRAVREAVERAGMLAQSNVFFLQRYGFASEHHDWEEPFVVGTNFTLVNPDGTTRGTNLSDRSEAMRRLP